MTNAGDTRRDWFILGAILALGLVLRLLPLFATNWTIDSDEAIVGLMAKHFSEGKPWSIFYYGQNYMGSLEPTLVAALFLLTGPSAVALKAVPLLFSLAHIVLVYLLAREFASRRAGLVAAGLTALAPSALVQWSAMARGGFIELVAIGSLCLLLTARFLKRDAKSLRDFAILSFLLGLGWWVNNQIVFYAAAIALVCGYVLLREVSWTRLGKFILVGGAVFAFGGAFSGTPTFCNILDLAPFASYSDSPRPTARVSSSILADCGFQLFPS